MKPCPCHEPRTPEHRCWATQMEKIEKLERVAEAARDLLDATTAIVAHLPAGATVPASLTFAAYHVSRALSALPAGEDPTPPVASGDGDPSDVAARIRQRPAKGE